MVTSHQVAWHWLREGWKFRGCDSWPAERQATYKARVKYEMGMIESKDFVDYFLIISDLVRYAKNSGYAVGPARGSAAASVVCWLLRITEVDPLLFPNLVFERFIDVSRMDLPDIDLDFESECRYDLYNYWSAKYGADCVANIGTFTYYRAKNSLDDVARVHRIPAWEVTKVKDRMIERSSGDLRASDTITDTAEQFPDVREVFERFPELSQAQELEGNVKGQSVHAAGLIVSAQPLRLIAPVYSRVVAGDAREVIVFDKYDAERQGMLKFDILGLSTMSMISTCLKWLDMPLTELYALPLDDSKVMEAFQRNDVGGIFQFDGLIQRGVCGELKPTTFSELCDINALSRPGPLHNGAVDRYVSVRKGAVNHDTLHPLYEAITGPTHGQPVYQEQILRVVTEIGGFDWTSAGYVRKIMSRKLGEQEFNRQGGRFIKGAAERGVSEETARSIWSKCITAGAYAFNAAHCVSYAMIAYWCMWLKVYHPVEFFAASLRHTATQVDKKKGINKPVTCLRDAMAHGVEVLPPALGRSAAQWQPEAGGMRIGFEQIPGIGAKVSAQIIDWVAQQPNKEKLDWADLTKIKGIGPKTAERISEWASASDPLEVRKMGNALEAVRLALRSDPAWSHVPAPTHRSSEVPYERVKIAYVVWLGLVHRINMRDLFEFHQSRTGEVLDPATVRDPHLNESVILYGQDDDGGAITITVDRWRYQHMKEAIWGINLGEDVVVVRGEKPGYIGGRTIKAHDIWVIES